MIQYYLYKFGQFCVRHLPLKLSYTIAKFMGTMHYYLCPRDRRIVKNNLKVILKCDQGLSCLAREAFENFSKYLTDFFRMPGRVDPEFIKANVTIENFDALSRALARGRGVIIVTAHIGNWELGGMIISHLGYPLVAVALPHKERSVNNLFNAQRQAEGMTIVPNNVAIRECIKALRNNRLVALLGDRDFGGNGVIMDFLGKPTSMPKGPATFAMTTGAAIVPAFLVWDNDDQYRLSVEDPIFPPENVPKEEGVKVLMDAYVRIIERKIRQYPSQWFMFQRFWKE